MTIQTGGRMLGGAGMLIGPPANTQFKAVVNFLKKHFPEFREFLLTTKIYNENGLNSRLGRFITSVSIQNSLDFFAERETMEDETKGNSPAVDIGIYLNIQDLPIDPPLITVFEGKRLSKDIPKIRRREYVIGHEKDGKHIKCGGIERFKLGIHGKKLNSAGMIGYLQTGAPESWETEINTWIRELAEEQHNIQWAEDELLTRQDSHGHVTEYVSIVNRADNELYLTHLWIDLIS